MTAARKVLLIECWLGPFPAWRPLYEASCRANSQLDFLVFTDQVTEPQRAGNLRFQPITAQELQGLVCRQTDTPLSLDLRWDLTKLKPAYGTLFADWVKDYLFWGFHDSDLIWGRTEKFLTDERLEKYDAITASAAWVVGHFSIFKVGSPLGRPHQLIPDYWPLIAKRYHKGVCVDEEILDAALARRERAGQARVLRAQWLLGEGFHPRWKRHGEENIRIRKPDTSDYIFEQGICRWDGRRLVHEASGREALYFHFQHWKKKYKADRVSYSPRVAEYRFTPERIEAVRFKHRDFPSFVFWARREALPRTIHQLKLLKATLHRRLVPTHEPA